MAEQKTKPTAVPAKGYLNSITDEQKRADSFVLLEMMQKITGLPPVMWGNMIGFGTYHYKYASGHEGDIFMVGFLPGKDKFSLYLTCGNTFLDPLYARLGKYKHAVSCLYIKRLSDIDLDILEQIIAKRLKDFKAKNVTAKHS